MKKRFIICIDNSTEEDKSKFIEYLKSSSFAWWHYLSDTWLLSDTSGKYTAATIRDKVREFFPTDYLMVFELSENGDTWSGFGPNTEERNMFAWIRKNWSN